MADQAEADLEKIQMVQLLLLEPLEVTDSAEAEVDLFILTQALYQDQMVVLE